MVQGEKPVGVCKKCLWYGAHGGEMVGNILKSFGFFKGIPVN